MLQSIYMISIQDVEKLANLSRLALAEAEKASFSKEIGAILGYVGQINTLSQQTDEVIHTHTNILRDDVVTNESFEYKNALLALAPKSEGDYIKVKKIIE